MKHKKHRRSRFLFKESRAALADIQKKVKKGNLKPRHSNTEWIWVQEIED